MAIWPLVFRLTPEVDGQAGIAIILTISDTTPTTPAPANGDLWLDVSGTDTNLGNGTAGTIIPAAAADYILKRYVPTWGGWKRVPGAGMRGSRATIPIAFDAMRGTRLKVRVECIEAHMRYQLENFSESPDMIRAAQ